MSVCVSLCVLHMSCVCLYVCFLIFGHTVALLSVRLQSVLKDVHLCINEALKFKSSA